MTCPFSGVVIGLFLAMVLDGNTCTGSAGDKYITFGMNAMYHLPVSTITLRNAICPDKLQCQNALFERTAELGVLQGKRLQDILSS